MSGVHHLRFDPRFHARGRAPQVGNQLPALTAGLGALDVTWCQAGDAAPPYLIGPQRRIHHHGCQDEELAKRVVALDVGHGQLDWRLRNDPRVVVLERYRTRLGVPRLTLLLGLALGICGTVVLVGPQGIGGTPVDPRGAAVVLVGTLAWASGSVYSRSLPYHSTALRTSAIQMATGGSVVTLIALAHGDGATIVRNGPSTASLLSLVYLVVMGSVLGYTAYTYLLRHTSAARVSTYAFVNPVVAVVLGATFAGEPLSARVVLAGILIVAAVILVTLGEGERKIAADSLESSKPLAVEEAP